MSRHLDPGAPQWHRDVWLDAVWESETLKPNERVLAYAFARYAGRKKTTWCPWPELQRRTGIRSKNGVWLALKGLIDKGWLKETEKARQHYSARYELLVPTGQTSPSGTPEELQESPAGTTETTYPPVSTSPEVPQGDPEVPEMTPRGPRGGPDISNELSTTEIQPGGHAAPPNPPSDETPRKRVISTTPPNSPPEVVNDQPPLTTQPTTRVPAENNVIDFAASALRIRKECPQCQTWLDPDGSCFICRTPAMPRRQAAGAEP